MDYVKVHTRSLLQPSQATALHASHNSFSASTNLWNDLAKAMKASDGKKIEGRKEVLLCDSRRLRCSICLMPI